MSSIHELQRNWEGFAQSDPLWSICADPQKRNSRWNVEEFFATGAREVKTVLACLRALDVGLDHGAPALDFGCGVGRLTRAMAAYFPECYGVDISPTMVRLASDFNRDLPQCRFVLNEQDSLSAFKDNFFGFIYTSIVLQHIAAPYSQKYLAELVRLLHPRGALVFQVPDRLVESTVQKLRRKLALRSRLRRWLRPGQNYLMEMHCIDEREIRELVRLHGGKVVDVRLTNSTAPSFSGDLHYLERGPEQGFVSKQYCVVKRTNGPED